VVGWIGNRVSASLQLKVILAIGVILVPILALAPTFEIFAALTIPMGFFIGATFSVSRSYMSSLFSEDEMTYGFSFYTLSERFATLAGPLTWGGIIAVMGTAPVVYRSAVATMAVFILVGLLVLVFFKRPNNAAVSV
jgi:UMF1 family MFS transporter